MSPKSGKSTRARALTLALSAALVLALASGVPSVNATNNARLHNRMIKRRGPAPLDGRADIIGGGLLDTSSSSAAASETSKSTANASPTSSVASTTTTVSVASTTSATSSGGLLDTVTGILGSSTSSSVASSSTTSLASSSSTSSVASSISSSSIVSTSSAASQTSTPAQQSAPAQSNKAPSVSTATVTRSLDVTASPSATATQQGATSTPAAIARKTIVILVAIAGSIGLVFLIWTGIRKWKFRPSREFNDRMAPIDWQPTTDHDDPVEKVHRRNGSAGSHGSFGSSEHHGNGLARSGTTRSHPSDDLAHDFTAGTAIPPAPVAYADLQRGPQMSEGLTRGPSFNRGPEPDPYAAYTDYHAAPHQGYGATYPAAPPNYGYQDGVPPFKGF